ACVRRRYSCRPRRWHSWLLLSASSILVCCTRPLACWLRRSCRGRIVCRQSRLRSSTVHRRGWLGDGSSQSSSRTPRCSYRYSSCFHARLRRTVHQSLRRKLDPTLLYLV